MAQIVWRKRALLLLDNYIGNAREDFGRSTALKWAEEVAIFEARVKAYPSSYAPESLLIDKRKVHRRCHIMNRRFKIIYFFDERRDVVTIMDIWDTRMDPKALIKRIK